MTPERRSCSGDIELRELLRRAGSADHLGAECFRGLQRRDAEGLRTDDMGPVITIMVGRVEDWLKVLVDRDGTVVNPAAIASLRFSLVA